MSIQPQSPTSGRESAAASPISQVEDQIRDIQLNQQYESHDGGSEDEDMPLANAEKNVEQAPLVGEQAERNAIPSAAFSSASPSVASTKSSSGASHVGALKKMFSKRDQYLSLLTDMISGTDLDNQEGQTHIQEMSIKVEEINRLISTLKHSIKLSEASVKTSIFGINNCDNGGISLSKRNLPMFQLRTSATKYFPKDQAYDSIHHFLRSFEKVILSSGQSVDDVWRRYIPLTIPYDLDLWLNQDLLLAKSWQETEEKFTKKFNNAALKLDARREVQGATMKSGETMEEYYNRFTRAVMEAGYSTEDTTLGDTFLLGFPAAWKIQINYVLCAQYPGTSDFTAGQMVTCALNVLNTNYSKLSYFVCQSKES